MSSYSRVGGTPTIGSITVTTANYALYTTGGASPTGILDTVVGAGATAASVNTISIGTLTDAATDQTTLDGYISQVTAAINSVASAAANLGANVTVIAPDYAKSTAVEDRALPFEVRR